MMNVDCGLEKSSDNDRGKRSMNGKVSRFIPDMLGI